MIVDVFGSRHLDRAALLARWRHAFVDGFDADALASEIRASGPFAHVEIAQITYFATKDTYVTVDVVDDVDRAARMPFRVPPRATLDDPRSLVATWLAYEDAALALLTANAIPQTIERGPWWHAITFAHPTLAPYLERFTCDVPEV
ncbi:MAG TPA: hypothetical protein VK427_20430, partial [Kofleriaceae bacterium]|nr:hypothetical protein [Kofleriaceae bacterium]